MNTRQACLSFTLLALGSGSARAQQWTRQSPYPADNELRDTFFVSPDVGWVIGEDDIVLRTSDGGATWEQASSFPRHPFTSEERLNAIVFVDEQNGFLGGDLVYRTTDGGASWQSLGSHGQVAWMEFLSPLIGFVRSNGGLLRTADGGQTFQTVTQTGATAMDFFDDSKGLYTNPGVWQTLDAGVTWSQINSSSEAFRLIEYVSEDIVIGVGGDATNSFIHRSTDGGVTWGLVYSDNSMPQNRIRDLARIDDDSVAAIDVNYRVWVSDDAGSTWVRTQEPIGNWSGFNNKTSIHFPTPEVGYMSGAIGLIYKSLDGGHTWTKQNKGGAVALWDIDMRHTGFGVAVGEKHTVFRTDDFGQNWDVFTIDEPAVDALFQVQIITPKVVMACGHNTVYRSQDAGRTWTRKYSGLPMGYDWNGLSFLDKERGWLFGRSGVGGAIYQTTDGGDSWVKLRSVSTPGEGEMITPQHGWMVSFQTELLVTHDNWATFTLHDLPDDIFFDCDVVDENVGWILGLFEFLGRSEDGGNTLALQPYPGFDPDETEFDLRDIVATSADEVFVGMHDRVGFEHGLIFHSKDAGASWDALPPIGDTTHQFSGRISEFTVLPRRRIWTAGIVDGFIWTTWTPHEWPIPVVR